MENDRGLTSQPWVTIELDGDAVVVDGVPLQRSSPDDGADVAAALRRTADLVAAPLGRSVGATVVTPDGSRQHVAVRPDGRVDDLALLVAAASAPPVPVISLDASAGGAPEPPSAAPHDDPRARRGRVIAAVAILVALIAIGVTAAIQGWGGHTADDTVADPNREVSRVDHAAGDADAGAAGDGAAGPATSGTGAVAPKRLLVAEVTPRGPCRVGILVASPARAGQVAVTLTSPDGSTVRRVLTVNQGVARVLIEDLPAGPTRWQVTARGVAPLSGTVKVMPLDPDDA